MWNAVLALALAAVTVVVLGPGLASRFYGARARRRLGAAAARLSAGPVTLVGRIEVDGGACVRFDDGRSAAASTAALAHPDAGPLLRADVRAAQLVLVVGAERITLDGPVEVVAGSSETWAPLGLRRLAHDALGRVRALDTGIAIPCALARRPAVIRSLASGDTVRVRGRLDRLALGDGWAMAPTGEQGFAVQVAHEPGSAAPAPKPARAAAASHA